MDCSISRDTGSCCSGMVGQGSPSSCRKVSAAPSENGKRLQWSRGGWREGWKQQLPRWEVPPAREGRKYPPSKRARTRPPAKALREWTRWANVAGLTYALSDWPRRKKTDFAHILSESIKSIRPLWYQAPVQYNKNIKVHKKWTPEASDYVVLILYSLTSQTRELEFWTLFKVASHPLFPLGAAKRRIKSSRNENKLRLEVDGEGEDDPVPGAQVVCIGHPNLPRLCC